MDKLNDLLKEYSQDITVGDLDSLKVLRGFIKWLVENDKIDRKEFEKKLDDNEVIIEWDMNTRDLGIIAYKELLMLLAIQDEPIRFLCEILK